MKKILITILFLTVVSGFYSQIKFHKTYGGNQTEAPPFCFGVYYQGITTNNEGGYGVSHSTQSYGPNAPLSFSAYFLKLNASGDTLLTRTYCSAYPVSTSGMNIIGNPDGTYIMGLTYNQSSTSGGGAGILKIKSNGDTAWSRRFIRSTYCYPDNGYYITKTRDGGIVSVGNYGVSPSNGVIAKLDSSGNFIFGKSYNSSGHSMTFIASAECSNSDLIVAGSCTISSTSGSQIVLLKTDKNGNLKWIRKYGYANHAEEALDVKECSDKKIVIAGSCSSSGNTAFIMKTDSMGNVIFGKEYEDFGYAIGKNFVLDVNDNMYLSGNVGVTPNGSLAFLMKVNSAGILQWAKSYGINKEYGGAVTRTPDMGFAFVGMSETYSSGSSDVYVVKTDSLGDAGCLTNAQTLWISSPTYTSVSIPVSATSDIILAPAPVLIASGAVPNNICLVTSINENNNTENEFELFPNPATSVLHFSSGDISGKTSIIIKDVSGKTVYSETSNLNTVSIDVSHLAGGFYFISTNNNNRLCTKKFIKE